MTGQDSFYCLEWAQDLVGTLIIPTFPILQLDTEALSMSAFWSLLSPYSDRCVTLAPGTDATPGTRATSALIEPPWRVGRTQAEEPRPASDCLRMLYAARSALGLHPRGPAHRAVGI